MNKFDNKLQSEPILFVHGLGAHYIPYTQLVFNNTDDTDDN